MGKNENKYLIGFIIAILILMIGGVLIFSKDAGSNTSSGQKIPDADLIASYNHVKGLKNAKVTIVEFSDFVCPACGAVHPVVKQVLEKNKDKVRFVYRHFPLSIPGHEDALPAAEAAEAAGSQGKFWEMSDKLFENQKNLKFEDLNKYAMDLKLDMGKFTDELRSQKYAEIIQNDLNAGNKIGIDATPTFFINGIKMTDPPTIENFQKEIDKVK